MKKPKAADTTADPREIDWLVREAKRNNDNRLDDYLRPMMTSGRERVTALTLPGAGWLWEKRMIETYPAVSFTFFGAERDRELNTRARRVGNRITRQGKAQCYTLEPSATFSKVLEHPPLPQFDIIYADYMGTWSYEKERDVLQIFQHPTILASEGFLILTLSLTRNASSARGDALAVGRDSNQMVLDDRGDYRKSSKHMSQDVIPLARGIAESVCIAAEDSGTPVFPFYPHIYYNKGPNNTLLPEGSFCFRRET